MENEIEEKNILEQQIKYRKEIQEFFDEKWKKTETTLGISSDIFAISPAELKSVAFSLFLDGLCYGLDKGLKAINRIG